MLLFRLAIAALLWQAVFAMDNDDDTFSDQVRLLFMIVSVLLCSFPEEFGFVSAHDALANIVKQKQKGHTSPSIQRERKFVHKIFVELGPYYVRRAYRMKEDSFWKLHRLLHKYLVGERSSKKKHQNGATNGIITTPVRLSVAI